MSYGPLISICIQVCFQQRLSHYLKLSQFTDLFFLYLLPPIVLEAGYFMPNKAFVSNITTISLFAVAGTVMNIFLTSITFFSCCLSCMFLYWRLLHIRMPKLLQFQHHDSRYFTVFDSNFCSGSSCSLIRQVHIFWKILIHILFAVFEEIHVNKLLYITVFGESLLNDAVTVVSYLIWKLILSRLITGRAVFKIMFGPIWSVLNHNFNFWKFLEFFLENVKFWIKIQNSI